MNAIPYCKDCTHIFVERRGFECKAVKVSTNIVTGESVYAKAADERHSGQCGKKGKLFKPHGYFARDCKTCNSHIAHDNSCDILKKEHRIPVFESKEKYCGYNLNGYKRNIWLTITTAI